MTREEQRKEASYEFAIKFGGKDPTMMEIVALWFRRGAKWADEHPKEGLVDIDKALVFLHGIRLDYYIEHNDELVNDFRKVMEDKL